MIAEFVAFGIVSWIAGIWLTRTTDAIDAKYKLGSAFGGLLILGLTTSLPEIAVAISAALQHHYDIIIGTLIGGIAMQTVVLCLLDARMRAREESLSFAAASLALMLEAAVVILVTTASVVAMRTPVMIPHLRISIASLLIFALWLVGLWLIYKSRSGLPWKSEAIGAHPGREHHERQQVVNHPSLRQAPIGKVFAILAVAAIATLLSGVGLQVTGNGLANAFHINGGLFAATFIAFAGALPNISTGFSSIAIGDYKLAMSDIFGGNAIMPALFIFCDIVAGHSVLAHASTTDIWFASMGILLTGIYVISLVVRPRRTYFRMGIDSIAVLVLYLAGVVVLTV